MRIVSLVPGATEILAGLGAAHLLVGISHQCDYPASIRHLPRLTTTLLSGTERSGQIDARLRAAGAHQETPIALAGDAIRALAPDMIVTQALCEVCAISEGTVRRLSEAIQPTPEVVAMSGRTIAGVIHDILSLGDKVGTQDVRAAAAHLTRHMEEQFTTMRSRARMERSRPPWRVLCIEWLDPIFLAGHWVPELVECAGGVDVGAEPGAHSREVSLEEVGTLKFDMIFVMPCGFDIVKTRRELDHLPQLAEWLRRQRVPVVLIDADSHTSRPGPRLVEGATIMAAAMAGGRHSGFQEWR